MAKESACQCRRLRRSGFEPWVGKVPWRRKWPPILVFLPGKSDRQRISVGYSPQGGKKLDTTEHTCCPNGPVASDENEDRIRNLEQWAKGPAASIGLRCRVHSESRFYS